MILLFHCGLRNYICITLALIQFETYEIDDETRHVALFYSILITSITMLLNKPLTSALVYKFNLTKSSRMQENCLNLIVHKV